MSRTISLVACVLVAAIAPAVLYLATPPRFIGIEDNRVFQQSAAGTASFRLQWWGFGDGVELANGRYVAFSVTGDFADVPAGWYTAKLKRDGVPAGDEISIGVGDNYVVSGQSNSISQVQPEGFIPPVPPPGRVILNRFYAEGLRDAGDDPLDTHLIDAGVAWLYAGLALDRPWPVMFIMAGRGNSSTAEWSAELYPRISRAIRRYAPKAVLWHQGESDCTFPPVPQEASFANMAATVAAIGGETKWLMAINSTSHSPPAEYAEWPIRKAQRDIINAFSHVLAGPDTDLIRVPGEVEYRGDTLQKHGKQWAQAIAAHGL